MTSSPFSRRATYWLAASALVSAGSVPSFARAQTTTTDQTATPALASTPQSARSAFDGNSPRQTVSEDAKPGEEHIVVNAKLDQQRANLQPQTGATTYRFSRRDIETIPGGDNAPLNSVLLQAPGVAQDSYGQLHVRGDHNEIQFRLDGVELPEGLSVFGQALMTRFAHSMSLTTGALPSEYGFLQAGVIDITTKNGSADPGGDASIYGGARDYFFPSLQYGGHAGKWDYFATGDFLHDRVGIENPTPKFNALHDLSNQYHFLGHARYTADADTRISLTAGVSNAEYQLPNNPGQQRQFANPNFLGSSLSQQVYGSVDSDSLNERQKQITDFGILSLQKDIGDKISLQSSAVVRYSSLGYSPDPLGDLVYNGIAQRAQRSVFSTGSQTDVTWRANAQHTVRFGYQIYVERNISKTDSTVYPQSGVDDDGNPVYDGTTASIHDGNGRTGWLYGLYAQDEWRPLKGLTINYGLRFDGVDEYTHSKQVSPRLNIVYQPWHGGTFHAGYSRYFTPPPFELVGGTSLNKYANTSAAPGTLQDSTVKAERDHYFDAGFSQEILPGWHASFDGYMKIAKNLIDEGQFGSPIILSAFNYRRGQYTAMSSPRITNVAHSVSMATSPGRAPSARTSTPPSGTSIQTTLPISSTAGSIWTTINAGPRPLAQATRHSTRPAIPCASPRPWSTAVDYGWTPTSRMAVPYRNTRHSICRPCNRFRTCSTFRSSNAPSCVWTSPICSTSAMNCAMAAVSASAHRNTDSVARS